MKNRILIFLAVLIALVQLAGPANAQEADQVVLSTVILKQIEVVNEDGEKETKLVEVGNAIPGDELVFNIEYNNQGKEPAENVVLVNPVPEHTAYIAGSAGGETATVDFSVDGGRSYGPPESLEVTGKDGRMRPAVAGDYTHIRWVLTRPLAPGDSGSVYFRTRLK